jgi:hypothetical protein
MERRSHRTAHSATPAERSRTRRRAGGAIGAVLVALWMLVGAVLGVVVTATAAQAEALPPTIATPQVLSTDDATATVSADVTINDRSADVFFEYGRTDAYGLATPVGTFTDPATKPRYALLRNLQPGTTYHFRVVVANTAATTRSTDATFTTTGTAPPVVSAGPSPGQGIGGPDLPAATTPETIAAALAPAYVFVPKSVVPTVTGATAKTRRASVPLTCAADGVRCEGTLTLIASRRVTIADSRRTVTVATASFSIPSGTTAPVPMPITRAARTLISQAKRRHQLLSLATTLQGQPTATRPIALATTQPR